MKDPLGLELTGADALPCSIIRARSSGLQCFTGDPVSTVEEAIAARPDFVMAHVLKGYLFALSTEAAAAEIAREIASVARKLPADEREARHVAALSALGAGRWHEAGRMLAELTADHPRDALALQAGHQVDFFTGNSAMLRDRIAAALPVWDETMPGYHAILGMHAFGLEETGDYARAEAEGRRAVELEPRDGWAHHAVAHVMEMQCRQRDGIAWMRDNVEHWSKDSFLKIHNWWHLALYHYELGEADEVLALYDGPIYGDRSPLALNMLDASAILWRLHLGGVDAGDRWQVLADNWQAAKPGGHYAFNDMHATMAFVGAGRDAAIRALLEAQEAAIVGEGDNAAFTRDVGRPATLAVVAFGRGDYCGRDPPPPADPQTRQRFGGSHAQRDVLELTLIEAAIRAGTGELASRSRRRARGRTVRQPVDGVFSARAAELARHEMATRFDLF
jgi:tetratricopeptide (TPR) repeat protein